MDKPKYCQNCGTQLSSSSTNPTRGFLLCKVCRSVEVELNELMKEEIRLKVELMEVRAKSLKKPCGCFSRRIANLCAAIGEVQNQQEDKLVEYRAMGDKFFDNF